MEPNSDRNLNKRQIWQGLAIGFLTNAIASLIVWEVFKNDKYGPIVYIGVVQLYAVGVFLVASGIAFFLKQKHLSLGLLISAVLPFLTMSMCIVSISI